MNSPATPRASPPPRPRPPPPPPASLPPRPASPPARARAPAACLAAERHPHDALAGRVRLDPLDRRVLAQHDASRLARCAQRAEHQARVDTVVVRRMQRQAHGRRERRLAFARLASAQPLGRQAERVAKGDLALQLARLVCVARDQQRARGQQSDVFAGRRGQLVREGRPHVGRAQAEVEHAPAGLAELHLGYRREHPRRHARGAGAERVALEHRNAHAALSRAPGDRQADRAAADHEHVR